MNYIESTIGALQRLKDRYFRPVIAHPEGSLCHFGDCSIHRAIDVYGYAFCSCGFLHDLQYLSGELRDKLYSDWSKEGIKQWIRQNGR